eukprot:5649555-Pyramimonas_sp.AAC.1
MAGVLGQAERARRRDHSDRARREDPGDVRGQVGAAAAQRRDRHDRGVPEAVSYTHLTLPTILLV